MRVGRNPAEASAQVGQKQGRARPARSCASCSAETSAAGRDTARTRCACVRREATACAGPARLRRSGAEGARRAARREEWAVVHLAKAMRVEANVAAPSRGRWRCGTDVGRRGGPVRCGAAASWRSGARAGHDDGTDLRCGAVEWRSWGVRGWGSRTS